MPWKYLQNTTSWTSQVALRRDQARLNEIDYRQVGDDATKEDVGCAVVFEICSWRD